MRRTALGSYTPSQVNAMGFQDARQALAMYEMNQQHHLGGTAECAPLSQGGTQGITGGMRTLSFGSQEQEPPSTPLPSAQFQQRSFQPMMQQNLNQHGHQQHVFQSSQQQQQGMMGYRQHPTQVVLGGHAPEQVAATPQPAARGLMYQQQQQQQQMQFQAMDPSRRMTLAASTPEHSVGFSRLSMAPPPSSSRHPFGAALPPPSSQRFSMAPVSSSKLFHGGPQNMPRLSLAPQAGGQNGPRPSMGGRKANGKGGDKPAPSKSQQLEWCHEIAQFLTERKCDNKTHSGQQLMNATNKDFLHVFTFMAQQVDPTFALGAKPEEDVYQETKRLGYPGSLSKAQIVSASIPHVWPNVLAMLLWLSRYARLWDHTQQVARGQTSIEYLILGATSRAHLEEMCGNQEARDQTYQDLVATLNDGIDFFQQQLEEAMEHNAMLRAQVQNIESKPTPLEQKVAEQNQVASDLKMLDEAIVELANEKKEMEESKRTLEERLLAAKQELASVKQSNDEVKAQVAAQSVQLPEFQRMMGERRAREEMLRGVQGEIEEVQREKWQMEVEVTRQGKALQDAGKEYTEAATRLHMLPLGAKRAGGFDYSLTLSLHASKWDQILGNPHRLKGEMRTWLEQVVEEHNKAGAECERETIAIEAELAHLQAEAERLQREHVAAQSRIEKMDAETQAERERSRKAVEAMEKHAAELAAKTERELAAREAELRSLDDMAKELSEFSQAAALRRKKEEDESRTNFLLLQKEVRASIADVDAKLQRARALLQKEIKLPLLDELFIQSGISTDLST